MNRDDELERRLEAWLERGPSLAPAASVESVIDRVRRRPRRHPIVDGSRRGLPGMPRRDALELRRRSRSMSWLAAAASIVVAIGLLMTFATPVLLPPGVTSSPGASTQPSATPGQPSATPSAAPGSPTAPPSFAALPVSISGDSVCSEMDAGTVTHDGNPEVTTGYRLRCFDRVSDPRVAGVGYHDYTMEGYPDGSERWYGTATMSNEGGTWEGIETGLRAATGPHVAIVGFWLGSGGYAGLQYRLRVDTDVDSGTTLILAPSVLELVGSEAVTGVTVCVEPEVAPSLAPSSPAPDRILACSGDVDEPRLSGTRTLFLTMVGLDDGSSAISGTSHIENTAGTWDGQLSGAIDADGVTYRIDEIATGSGLYAGFELDGHLEGPIDALAMTGTISPAP